MVINRRTFLKTSALAAALTSAYGCQFKPEIKAPLLEQEYKERYVPSVCLQCPGGCGILVRVVNDRAVKIEGNPLYPSNKGKTCPKGQIGLQILYDPDRIKGPMRRVGSRGSNNWERIDWETAMSIVAEKIYQLRERRLSHSIIVMGGRYRGVMGDLFGRFCEAIGTPNNVGHSSICADGTPMAHWATQGIKKYGAYDWENCNYLLCFGGSFIEAWRPTAMLLRCYGAMRRKREGIRTKIVQVETRFSQTASKADEWIPINPSTDAALALGIAYVLISEELYDKEFIEKHTFGFEDWIDDKGIKHIGFKTLVLRDYSPERVSEITGVPEETISRIAIEFASKAPHCIAAGERGISMQSNGIYTRMAIHSLNALVGSIEAKGGILMQMEPPLTPFPDLIDDGHGGKKLDVDEISKKGLSMPRIDYAGTVKYPLAGKVYQDIPDRIIDGKPYEIKMIMAYYTNPLFSMPDVGRWHAALKEKGDDLFLVSFSPFYDEYTAYSDLILPDCTYLERWHDDVIYPSLGFPVWGLRQPVVKPLYDTMNTGDVIIKIAKKLGGRISELFPWKDMVDLLRYRARGVYEAKRGSIISNNFESWWKRFTEEGVWYDDNYDWKNWERVFKTPSGKFEFYSQNIKKKLEHIIEEETKKNNSSFEEEFNKMIENLKLSARGDEIFLPHFEKPRFVGDDKEYPFHLNTYKLITHAEGRGANVPYLQDMLGILTDIFWESWVEINPKTAEELGVKDGDLVYVESRIGRGRFKVKIMPGALPKVVNIPYELGHKEYGRWARMRGSNPNEIIANEHDNLGGLAAWFSTKVKIYKAEA